MDGVVPAWATAIAFGDLQWFVRDIEDIETTQFFSSDRNKWGYFTALGYALSFDYHVNHDIVRKILEMGADPNKVCYWRNDQGFPETYNAIEFFYLDADEDCKWKITRLLVDYGADPTGTVIESALKRHKSCARTIVWCFAQIQG